MHRTSGVFRRHRLREPGLSAAFGVEPLLEFHAADYKRRLAWFASAFALIVNTYRDSLNCRQSMLDTGSEHRLELAIGS